MIYASMRDCVSATHLRSCWLGLLVSFRPLAWRSDCSRPPVAGSRCDEYSDGTLFRPGIVAPEKAVGEAGWAAQKLPCSAAPRNCPFAAAKVVLVPCHTSPRMVSCLYNVCSSF